MSESGGKDMLVEVDRELQIKKRLFNVAEYHLMVETGIISERDRVELIEGEIVEMSPIGSRHAANVDSLVAFLSRQIRESAIIRVQSTVRFSETMELEPDLALLKPREDFYAGAHPKPGDVLILIEVANTSLKYDRTVKSPLHARSGIPETWIVDLTTDTIERHANPTSDGYRETVRFKRGDTLESRIIPDLRLAVSDVLV